ncbi:Pyruvate kinase, barrel [Dillenia turbinata]|uniref:Pyruvate kinase, barrel n=1 Tax=Dillenia turbinata TaxID=194707 RepID=A0AAN8W131_9MAGN
METQIELKADNYVTITPDITGPPSKEVLPINYAGLATEWSLEQAHFWLRTFLNSHNLDETQIFAKVETVEVCYRLGKGNAMGMKHFDEILREADGIIISCGNLGVDLPPEKWIVMTDNLRPTRAEATDVANAVLDGAGTLQGQYPVGTVNTGEFVQRLIAKYRLPVPVFAIIIPRLGTNSLNWTLAGSSQATSGRSSEESGLKVALQHGKSLGLLSPNDGVVVF